MFIVFIVIALVAVIAFIIGIFEDGVAAKVTGGVATLLAAIALLLCTAYTQDPGEARVLKNWSGAVEGTDFTEGFSFKAPWVDLIDYDIRNQQAVYIGAGADDYNGKKPDGPQITVQDKDGVSADADIVVRYSIRPDRLEQIYREYGSQENFKARLISNDIRSVVRNAPTGFSTIDVLTKRGDIERQIMADLTARWDDDGVQIESVALQEIRYPQDVRQRFADAQNARTEVTKAQAQLEATKITAQQKVVQAEAEAEANRILGASLSDPILQQRYLDTLREVANKEGNVIVVPEGTNPLLSVK